MPVLQSLKSYDQFFIIYHACKRFFLWVWISNKEENKSQEDIYYVKTRV